MEIQYQGSTYTRMNASIPATWIDAHGNQLTSVVCMELDYVVKQAERKAWRQPLDVNVSWQTTSFARILILMGSIMMPVMIPLLIIPNFLDHEREKNNK